MKKKLKMISKLFGIASLVSVFGFSLFFLLDHKENQQVETSAYYYYQNVDLEKNEYSIFGNVNNINESFYEDLPSYQEDSGNQVWTTTGQYYITINQILLDTNTYRTDVQLQYKLNTVWRIQNSEDKLNTTDIYYINDSNYRNVGSKSMGNVNKPIISISFRQYYIYVNDDLENDLTLGFALYFLFNDSTTYNLSYDYLVFDGVLSNDGYDYEDTSLYIMDYLNIGETTQVIQNNTQGSLDGYYNWGYDVGYSSGYSDGVESQETNISDAYSNGYADGYNTGFNADSTAVTIFNGILTIALVPINFFLGMFNFNILGINLTGFIQALFTVVITIIVVKTIIGSKGGDSGD